MPKGVKDIPLHAPIHPIQARMPKGRAIKKGVDFRAMKLRRLY